LNLYLLTKYLMRVAAHLYFVDIQSSGRENLPAKEPVILAANHPASLLDGIILGTQIQRRISYLAKSDLFRFPVIATFFNNLGFIPIYRAVESSRYSIQNTGTFERVYQLLEKRGCIGIFPEGQNSPERQVAEIRTGTARMALEAEARNNYELGLKIVPVGLSFENRDLLLSSVFLNFQRPIRISDYAAMHKSDPTKAIKSLTYDLQQALRSQTLHIENYKVSELVSDLSEILRQGPNIIPGEERDSQTFIPDRKGIKKYWDGLLGWFRPAGETQRDLEHTLKTRQKINTVLSTVEGKDPDSFERLRRDVDRYKAHLSQARMRESLSHSFDKPVQERLIRLRTTLYAFFMAPFALVGFLHNIIPYLITFYTARFFREEAIRSFAYFIIGIAVFSCTYLIYGIGFWYFLKPSVPWCLLYLVAVLWTGFASLRYRRTIMFYRNKILLRAFLQTQEHLIQRLSQERMQIIAQFQNLSKQYPL